jgi:hypothetical protein
MASTYEHESTQKADGRCTATRAKHEDDKVRQHDQCRSVDKQQQHDWRRLFGQEEGFFWEKCQSLFSVLFVHWKLTAFVIT